MVDDIIAEIEKNDLSDGSLIEKYIELKKILERFCREITIKESLQFPSFFSRLVFIVQKYKVSESLEKQLQYLRVKSSQLNRNPSGYLSDQAYISAYTSVKYFVLSIYGLDKYGYNNQNIAIYSNDEKSTIQHNSQRLVVIDIDEENRTIKGKLDGIESDIILIKYGVEKINNAFNDSIKQLWLGAQINIIDSIIDKNGYYIPKFIVIEPDYLIDASALAECFQNHSRSHLHYFRNRFEQIPNSQYILLGNLANYFLDEFIFSEDPQSLEFNDVFVNAFKLKPFEFTSCNDIKQNTDFRAFMVKAKSQFENIKRVVLNDFKINEIDPSKSTLEPSFFCAEFGFQGRLDLLQVSEYSDNKQYKIVELKSGGLPYPKTNANIIAINHEVQTAIYRLIISSVFKCKSKDIFAAILYSAGENPGENMRLAAPYQTLDKEIINVRNLIVSTEHHLYSTGKGSVKELIESISDLKNYERSPQFFIDKIIDFDKIVKGLSTIENDYLYRFISFISRELYIYKVGDDYQDSSSSIANLWNTSFLDRQEAFDLISDLEIVEIDDSGHDLKILFERKVPNEFSNFREGELCILYPHDNDFDNVLTNQILKGSITKISDKFIILRFRYKQKNKTFFEKHKSWAVEHDRLDHAYTNMYKSLYKFAKANPAKRKLLLGITPPSSQLSNKEITNYNINTESRHNNIINKAIAANDYFLIVGPPGTGKTSIFARNLIDYYYHHTNENILIIAYTNRAVDELCDAINQVFMMDKCDKYIRIGTELSCGEEYRDMLLQNVSKSAKSRDDLRKILANCRIFVGTLASIIGKPELFDMKKFGISIIDEASQILEPQIIGLLTNVDKFIMIGDHKQLSTITLQNTDKSKVLETALNDIELFDCRESLFERLFRLCKKNKWDLAYDTLVYQGRMHLELSNFPNKYFYDNMLLIVNEWQQENLCLRGNSDNYYENIVSSKRIHFIDTENTKLPVNDKINSEEADIVVELCLAIIKTFETNRKIFDPQKSLGIITPYRNQIALIKHKLKETGIAEFNDLMIDTVERFQGSQRDIIILSFCINKPYQLDFFCNLNIDGTVDRKLNVAITRAREQLFLIGNKHILKTNPIYKKYLNQLTTQSSSN